MDLSVGQAITVNVNICLELDQSLDLRLPLIQTGQLEIEDILQ